MSLEAHAIIIKMSFTKYTAVAVLLAYAEARFGQEQVPVSAVSALSDFGNPGEAATLAGSVPGVLLAAANPCDKVGTSSFLSY